MDYKSRVIRAMEGYHARQNKKAKGPTRKNQQPERDLVQNPCLAWMRSQGFKVDIYEAKATYDPKRGIYRQQAMKAGTVDCIGTDPSGYAVFIEFKAPGRRGTLRDAQRIFLLDKIEAGAFAVVIDDVNELMVIYCKWAKLKKEESDQAKDLLRDYLPKQGKVKLFW